MTPNQIVAHNLREARLLKGWTQEEAAEHLEPYLGVRWSKSTFSAAERSCARERVREFTADEIVAFASAFNLSVSWFFLPPSAGWGEGPTTEEDVRLLKRVLGWPVGQERLEWRVGQMLGKIPLHEHWLRDASFRHTNTLVLALLARVHGKLEKQAEAMERGAESMRDIVSATFADVICETPEHVEANPNPEGVEVHPNPEEGLEVSQYLLARHIRRGGEPFRETDEEDRDPT